MGNFYLLRLLRINSYKYLGLPFGLINVMEGKSKMEMLIFITIVISAIIILYFLNKTIAKQSEIMVELNRIQVMLQEMK